MVTEQKQLFDEAEESDDKIIKHKNLPYNQQLSKLRETTFESFIRLSGERLANRDHHSDSTYETSDALYDAMDRGKAILNTEEQVDKYMSAFGRKHYLKFITLFQSVPTNIFDGFYDIVDWGAGCGLGIIALNEFCRKTLGRNIESYLRKVILIEPSSVALTRAKDHTHLLFPESDITVICKRFEHLKESDFPHSALGVPRIHLLSNVLDLDIFQQTDTRGILCAIIKKIFRRYEYFLCVSPTYNSVERTFEMFFEELCDDDVTERTIYGPANKVFTKENDGRDVKMTGVAKEITSKNAIDKLGTIRHKPLVAEMNSRRDSSEAQRRLVQAIAMQCVPEDVDILYRPYLMGMQPDMLILKRQHKAMLFYSSTVDDLSSDNANNELLSVCETINNVKSRLYNLLSRKLRDANTRDGRNYNLIICCIYLPKLRITESVLKQHLLSRMVKIRPNNIIDIQYIRFHIGDVSLKWLQTSEMDDDLYRELSNLVSPSITQTIFDKKIDFSKDKKQRELIVSSAGRQQKVSGVFGAGKTAVLAERACAAFRRTHKPVLILTFNITLRSYIESMLYRQFGSFNRNQFCVVNYHEFINGVCLSIGNKVRELDAYCNTAFFKQNRDKFIKFQTILIDEAQDFKYEWFNIIRDTFLGENGEYVLFGDEKQNIYGNPLDEQKKYRTNIPGNAHSLSSTYRSNPTVTARLNKFQRLMFKLKYDTNDIECCVQDLFVGQSGLIDVYNVRLGCIDQVIDSIINVHETHNIPYAKIVVLGEGQRILRECDKHYRDKTGLCTECMFISSEECNILFSRMKEDRNSRFKDELRSRERSMKLHFDARRDMIKFSTINSFKGFEEETIILIVQPQGEGRVDTELELLYSGLTRAKENLFIINYGNTRYGNQLKDIFGKSSRMIMPPV